MVSLFSKVPLAVYVRTELPVNNIDELVAYAKAQGDKPLSYGSVGIGSIFHLAAEDLREAAGLRLIHIPYRGGMPMLQDLMANRLDMALFPADSNLARMVAAGKMRAICVTGTVRAQALPSVPTFAESRSLPNFNTLDVWAGVLAPAATSERAVHALYEAARAALAEPDVVKAVESALGTSLSPPMSLEQLADFYAGEVTRFAAAAKRAKLERN
jgi:tripartite-type tricarboxylate transporter receptor subunit TctC